MKNKILLSCIIIILSSIIIILITSSKITVTNKIEEEKINSLDKIESITIYSIDAHTGMNYDKKKLSEVDFTTIDNPTDYFSKIIYKNEIVLWKGDRFGIVHMKDGNELKIRVSCYGDFFSIIGKDGYYTYEKAEK